MIAALAASSTAHADSPGRKAVPAKYLRAASSLFEQALAADAKKNYRVAAELYEQALQLAPNADTAYNFVAATYAYYRGVTPNRTNTGNHYELEGPATDSWASLDLAINVFLAIAPDGPDRKEVSALRTRLTTTPVDVEIIGYGALGDLSSAYVLVDGKVAERPVATKGGRASIVIRVVPGEHEITVVSEVAQSTQTFHLEPERRHAWEFRPEPIVDGNVVLHEDFERLGGGPIPRRIQLAPGRHRIPIARAGRECRPLDLVVPAQSVLFVWRGSLNSIGCPIAPRVETLPFKP